MRMLFRYQKLICLFVLFSFYWLCTPQPLAQAAMITTEDTLDRGSKADFDRARIKAFVSRKDVIAQLHSYGISSEEVIARVDSLTDQEIALIAGKLDQLQAGGTAAWGTAGPFLTYAFIGVVIIAIIITIIMIALDEGPNKPTYRKF